MIHVYKMAKSRGQSTSRSPPLTKSFRSATVAVNKTRKNQMWKWLGGCLLIVLLLAVGGTWWGYQKMQSSIAPDGSVRVMIAGTPERVFGLLSNGDSIGAWMAGGNAVFTNKHGTFIPGDSIRIGMRMQVGPRGEQMTWQITQVVPGQVVARQLISPDPGHKFVADRRDSVVQVGDSTLVVSTTTTPGPTSSTTSSVLALSMFRVQS